MNQITNNVKHIIEKYGDHADTENKLTLLYWKEFESLKFDGKYIDTRGFLNLKTKAEDIINAREILKLLEESEDK